VNPTRALRVVLADDATLIRQGIARLLADAGIEVVGQAADASELMALVNAHSPDVAIVDIRMPPTYTDEGLVAARRIREVHPLVGVLVLSQYVDVAFAMGVVTERAERVGYLLKERAGDIDQFASALRHVADGGTIVDPALVAELVRPAGGTDPLAMLTERERQVLALLAEGRTDRGIAEQMFLAPKTVEGHVRSVFRKLDLPVTAAENRRVHAVLAYLRARTRADS
jgi:DNA-binding NarL/FixJ family response regulator